MVAFVRVNLVGMLVYLFSNYIALSYIHENKEGWFHYTIVVVYTVLNQFLLFYSPLNSRINAVTFTNKSRNWFMFSYIHVHIQV